MGAFTPSMRTVTFPGPDPGWSPVSKRWPKHCIRRCAYTMAWKARSAESRTPFALQAPSRARTPNASAHRRGVALLRPISAQLLDLEKPALFSYVFRQLRFLPPLIEGNPRYNQQKPKARTPGSLQPDIHGQRESSG